MDFLLAQVANREVIDLPMETTHIQKFYSEKTLLITGGTGSVGKLLIGKLLQCCPDIQKIYLLVRPKNVNQIGHRMAEFTSHPCFAHLPADSLRKLILIRGDLSVPKLGILEKDYERLVTETEIVFHVGGTTLFDESFRSSASVNVRGTCDFLQLAKNMKKLQVFLHVSTVFANCHLNILEENFQRAFIPGKVLIDFLQGMDPNVHYQKPINLGKYPNNFIFTKSIAEDLIKNEMRALPVVIVRLPLLISSEKYPSRGYTDNVNSIVGLTMTSYLGLNKSILAKKDIEAEVFPIDMAANAMIAIAWDTAKFKSFNDNIEVPKEDQVTIYNLTSSKSNRLTWKLFFGLSSKYGYRFPTIYTLSLPWYILHDQKNWHFFLITVFHYIPGYLIDFVTLHLLYKTKYIGYYSKIDMLSRSLTYFTTHSWDVKADNMRRLIYKMDESDKDLFDFDIAHVDWESYFEYYIRGIRKFILKDTDSTIILSRRQNTRRLFVLIGKIVFILILLYFYFGISL